LIVVIPARFDDVEIPVAVIIPPVHGPLCKLQERGINRHESPSAVVHIKEGPADPIWIQATQEEIRVPVVVVITPGGISVAERQQADDGIGEHPFVIPIHA
jgi:hypothetical protein